MGILPFLSSRLQQESEIGGLSAKVQKIHITYAALWPNDTNIADLLPRPDGRVFRALYVGLIDPRTIAASVIGWLRYFDEIFVINPFTNATLMRPAYSPKAVVSSPAANMRGSPGNAPPIHRRGPRNSGQSPGAKVALMR